MNTQDLSNKEDLQELRKSVRFYFYKYTSTYQGSEDCLSYILIRKLESQCTSMVWQMVIDYLRDDDGFARNKDNNYYCISKDEAYFNRVKIEQNLDNKIFSKEIKAKLSPTDSLIFDCLYIVGFTLTETASFFGISTRAMSDRIDRMHKRIIKTISNKRENLIKKSPKISLRA